MAGHARLLGSAEEQNEHTNDGGNDATRRVIRIRDDRFDRACAFVADELFDLPTDRAPRGIGSKDGADDGEDDQE